MNILESVYCYLHHERKKQGQALSSDATTGNIVVSLSLIMFLIGFFFLLVTIVPSLGDSFEDMLKDMFGRKSGKTIGQVLILVLLAIVFPIISKTIGTQQNFERIKTNFVNLSEKGQAKVAKRGATFFIGSVLFLVIPIFLKGILG